MERPSSSVRAFENPNLSRSWSPTSRPTLNTSSLTIHPPLSNPSDPSPHPSSIPPSSHSSPWSQDASLGPSHPHLNSHPSSRHVTPEHPRSFSDPDWSNIFSAPLNPTVFAALAANGVIGPVNSGQLSSPSSLPASSFHDHFPRSHTLSVSTTQASPSSWSQPPTLYAHPYSAKPSLARSNSTSLDFHHGVNGAPDREFKFHPLLPCSLLWI